MEENLTSLAFIALLAFTCPIISQLIPGRPISETVLLLVTGMIFGPACLDLIHTTDAVDLLSDLGLGFLFLLAGYEIDVKILTGHQGRRGLVTWFITLGIAFLTVVAWPTFPALTFEGVAVTIALTTTAIGTLLPILEERGMINTPEGESVLSYGTWGELMPILAMTLLLSTRAEWLTIVILAAFVGIAVLVAVIPARARRAGFRIFAIIEENAETNAQMIVRVVLLLLIGLLALSSIFNLDIVLGSFAAGFILRYVLPEGSAVMENKIHSIAFGFFIPLFFIVSGTAINPEAIAGDPSLLVVFIILLLFVRALPIFVSMSLDEATASMKIRNRLTVAFYCTTALPIIVAVTTVATSIGAMTTDTASVLVAAGGITVLIMPIAGSLTLRTVDAEPLVAIKEIIAHPAKIGQILHRHHSIERTRHEEEKRAIEMRRYGIRHSQSRRGEGPSVERRPWASGGEPRVTIEPLRSPVVHDLESFREDEFSQAIRAEEHLGDEIAKGDDPVSHDDEQSA